jgi:hypothetical protein
VAEVEALEEVVAEVEEDSYQEVSTKNQDTRTK